MRLAQEKQDGETPQGISGILQNIVKGERVVYYRGLVPMNSDQTEGFATAMSLYLAGRVRLFQRVIEHGQNWQKYEYIAEGR